MSAVLYLAATPIGNIGDASPRLRELLETADVVAAEDTRRTVRLLRDLGITAPGRLVSFHESVERDRTPELIAELEAGKTVALVTDAGMPSVSDPGYRLCAAAVAAGIRVSVIPGPSAVLAALAVSGLPVERFTFEGFLPRTKGQRVTALHALVNEPRTMVFFEAPHRAAECVADMSEVLGDARPAVLCRELTKTYEEVVRGTLSELAHWCQREVLGEITLVVQGATPRDSGSPAEWVAYVESLVGDGASTRDAVAQAAEDLGVARREVYDAVTSHRKQQAKG